MTHTHTAEIENLKEALQILELPEDASIEEASKNYRKLSLKYHPDKQEQNFLKGIQDTFLSYLFIV